VQRRKICDRTTANAEAREIRKETAMTYLKTVFSHLPGESTGFYIYGFSLVSVTTARNVDVEISLIPSN
jgi:hypothetical protein